MAVIIKSGEGSNVNEFCAKVNPGFELKKNATRAWKDAGMPAGEEFKKFCEEYINSNLNKTDLSGGFYIVTESPVNDSRKKPFTVDKNINEGTRKFKTSYMLTGAVSGLSYATLIGVRQSVAIKKASAFCKEKKEDIKIDVIKVCIDGVSCIATVNYTPSINHKLGQFIVFGRVEGTVNL